MKNRYRNKAKHNVFWGILRITVLLLLAYGAIRIGIAAGNALYKVDANIVEHVDVNSFKKTLNHSFPLMDTVYNSGNISVSISGEIKSLVESIFNFDLSRPITMLNSQSPLMYIYYNRVYLQYADNSGTGDLVDKDYKIDYSQNDEPGAENPAEPAEPKESSISTEGDEEKKDPGEEDIIADDGQIRVINETKNKIDKDTINRLLKEPLKFKLDKKGPKALILHTHTTESYLRDLSQLNNMSLSVRNSDPRYNVVRVGEALAQGLRKNGMEVLHNGTVHNYPSDVGAYARSLSTAGKYLKSYPSIKFIFDIHRDGGTSSKKLRVVTNVKGKSTAQVMFVVGTNATGLNHPNWKENLKLALKLQEKLNEQCPGLARPIYISENRYNQHLAPGALIIEIGGEGNILSEAMESTQYLARAVSDVIK